MAKKEIAYINRNMLIWARKQTPFKTIEDACEKLGGITPEKLLKYELGEDLPSISECKKMAQIYDVPFAAFYLTDTPADLESKYMDRRTALHACSNVISYNLWRNIRRIVSNREILMEIDDENVYNFKTLPNISARDSSEEVANKIRLFLGMNTPLQKKSEYKPSEYGYFKNLIENAGIIVSQIYDVDVQEIKGLSLYFDRYPIIANNTDDFEKSKIFTLFHEIAHLIRRSSSLCLIDFNGGNDREERICDEIAASCLMPKEKFICAFNSIKNDDVIIKVDKMSSKFCVSKLSALVRMYKLDLISNFVYEELYAGFLKDFLTFTKRKKAKSANLKISPTLMLTSRNGNLFPRVVLSALGANKINIAQASNFMNLKTRHFSNLADLVMR